MASKRQFLFFSLLLAALFLLGALPVLADEAVPSETLEITLQVAEDGSWALPSFGGVNLGLNSRSLGALAETLNSDLAVPTIDPEWVRLATENDIATLAVVKEGKEITILINNQALSSIALGDPVVATLNEMAPDLQDLIDGLSTANVAVGVQVLDPRGAAPEIDLTARLRGADEAIEVLNTIELGGTLSPDGRLISIAGISTDQIAGLDNISLETSLLQQFAISHVEAEISGAGTLLRANQEEWVRLNWDLVQLADRTPRLLDSLAGIRLSDDNQRLADLAISWLTDTRITVAASLADEPQEAQPRVQINRPVRVELTEDNNVLVEGIALNMNLGPQIGAYRDEIQTVALRWRGEDSTLYPVINDTPYPYLTIESGLAANAGNLFLDPSIPWGQVAGILNNVGFTVTVAPQGSTPPDVATLEYQAQPAEALAAVDTRLTISRADGAIAVDGQTLPINLVERLVGVSVLEPVRAQVASLTGVETVALSMSPAGVTLGLNGSSATLAWDDDLRDALVNLASKLALRGREIDLTPVTESGLAAIAPALRRLPGKLEVGMIRTLVAVVNQIDFSIEIELQDEPLPPSFVESAAAAGQLGPFAGLILTSAP